MTTFNLTTGPDNLSGGSSNDTFIATYNDGMTGTFSIGDALNGNAGIDTLDITPLGVAAIAPPDTLWTNISNIEKIVINPTGEGAQTITTGAAFQAAVAAAGIGLKTTSGAGAITTDMSSFTGAIALTTISDAGAQTLTTGTGLATILATSTAGAQTITTGTGLATVMATSTAGAQTIAGANLTSVKIASTAGGQTITSNGVMLMRYLLGGSVFSGDALINGAISATATRNVTQIRSYLEQGVLQKDLDIDGNGSVTALSDGLIAQRYLFGATFSGNALIAGAIAPDATRDLAGIQSYMAGLTNLT